MEEPNTALTLAMSPPKPQLPLSTSDDSFINLGNVMKEIIPYVLHHLRAVLASGTQFADMPLHLQQPLDIKTKSQTSELVSYKDLWNTDKAVTALTTAAMYEAAGSLIWCNAFPASGDEEVLAGDPVLWSQVREVADAHFRVAGTSIKELASSPVKGTAPGKAPAETRGVTRIMFPITLPLHVTEINQAKNQYMLSCLHVLSGGATAGVYSQGAGEMRPAVAEPNFGTTPYSHNKMGMGPRGPSGDMGAVPRVQVAEGPFGPTPEGPLLTRNDSGDTGDARRAKRWNACAGVCHSLCCVLMFLGVR